MLLLLSLLSFNAGDTGLNHINSGRPTPQNEVGFFGAYIAGFLSDVFGVASLLWPFVFAALGAAYVSSSYTIHWWRWCGFFLLTVCLLVVSAAWDFSLGDLRGGGFVGSTLHHNVAKYLSPVGSALLWSFLFIVGLQLACDISWFSLLARCAQKFHTTKPASAPTPLAAWRQRLSKFSPRQALDHVLKTSLALLAKWRDELGDIRPMAKPLPTVYDENLNACTPPENSDELFPPDTPPVAADSRPPQTSVWKAIAATRKRTSLPLPDIGLLTQPQPRRGATLENREAKGKTLIACLKDFDIQSELVRITPGPVVTMYEVRPAPGTRVSRISNLNDDLALTLKATSIRIQAPIPGSDTVGIEIPNENRETVSFHELASSEAFVKDKGQLTMILGKDIAGQPFMADLAAMPHLLVAGATGAGKSVCLNSILVSLLYKTRPEDMRLLLVDPKRIEMAVYADEPHLVHPVVTETDDAQNALKWAVHEMDRRYDAMARLRVRNILGFNQKLAAFGNDLPPTFENLEPLPYLVIVIDELADLMMTAAREVETNIVRLAQLARAAGIHMILATQRPSVDVVTGLIKANFPCRISFHVPSKHDSRTILDQVGAEHLLGRGDMLFKPSGERLRRLHGPFLSDEEVQNVVAYWKNQMPPTYTIDFAEWNAETVSGNGDMGGDAAREPLYADVRAFVADQGQASISLIQRRFNIGFNRAARIVEQLEKDGIIGPASGSKPRQLIR